MLRIPAYLSLRKATGTPREKADMIHMPACEQGLFLGWVNTRPSTVKLSKKSLALESSVSEDNWQKPSSEQCCILGIWKAATGDG
jgi:hypothetical protein